MGTSGRYGKYGETKRLARLRKTGPCFLPAGRGIMPSRAFEQFGERPFSRTKIKIIPAGIMDSRYIRSLITRVFGIYGPYDDTLTNWFLTGMTFTIMALSGKKNVGFAMLGRSYLGQSAPRVYELLAIAVEPEMHRQGVGGLLMKAIENECGKSQAETLVLHTSVDNLSAQRLFKKFGFSALGTKAGFYPEGQDAILMSKDMLWIP
jgi:ribosomal protein S18 acetylase RimI-like enzyme